MKITKIEIKKLFNNFDYTIPINLENRVTILIGPNGSGKTVILRMLDSITNNDYSIFYEVPFESFNIFFDDDTNISVVKNTTNKNKNKDKRLSNKKGINIIYSSENKKNETYYIAYPRTHPNINSTVFASERNIIDYEVYINSQIMHQGDLVRYRDDYTNRVKKEEPFWYKEVKSVIKTILIGTDRLYNNKKIDSNKNDIKSTVIMYSSELAKSIQKKLSEFSSVSMTLDKTFPSRLIEQQLEYKLNEKQLFSQLSDLEDKRKRLKEAGLFYDNDDTNLNLLLKGNASEKSILTEVLAIYCDDTNKKLSIFDDLLAKIELFKNIIDRLFMYKKITFNKDRGFIFYSLDNDHIPIESLSSGEQHELVLFYELIFKIEKNTLLLIDEPEISLHLFWQQQFLADILDICKLSNVKAIIATHSANIINNNWDLTVDLEEQQYEE